MAYVLGIDPSLTATGIAIISDNASTITCVVRTKSDQPLARRLATIREATCVAATQVAKGTRAIPTYPWLVCVERPFAGMTKASAAAGPVLGAAYGAVLLGLHDALQRTEVPVLTVPPTVRAKYATGNGKASKDEVLLAASRRFGYEGSNNNEADALIFAWIAAEVIALQYDADLVGQFPFPRLPQNHYDPIDKWEDWERVL